MLNDSWKSEVERDWTSKSRMMGLWTVGNVSSRTLEWSVRKKETLSRSGVPLHSMALVDPVSGNGMLRRDHGVIIETPNISSQIAAFRLFGPLSFTSF